MIKDVTHAYLEPIWYHWEPSYVPYSPNQFLGCDFFCRFLQQDSSSDFGHLFEDGNKLKISTEIKPSWKMMMFWIWIWISYLNFALSSGHNSGDQLREEEKYSKLSQEASISRNLSWEDDDDVITPISNRKKLSWVSECAEVQYIIWPTKVILIKSCGCKHMGSFVL